MITADYIKALRDFSDIDPGLVTDADCQILAAVVQKFEEIINGEYCEFDKFEFENLIEVYLSNACKFHSHSDFESDQYVTQLHLSINPQVITDRLPSDGIEF